MKRVIYCIEIRMRARRIKIRPLKRNSRGTEVKKNRTLHQRRNNKGSGNQWIISDAENYIKAVI